MSLLSRVQRGLQVGFRAARGETDINQVAINLDQMLADGKLDDYLLDSEQYKAAQKKTKSFLNIHRTSSTVISLYTLLSRTVSQNELPPQGDPSRDIVLADFWKREPLLAGAVYSMSAKMTALSWTIIGRKQPATFYTRLFARAAGMDSCDLNDLTGARSQGSIS